MTFNATTIRVLSIASVTVTLFQPFLGLADTSQTERQQVQAMEIGLFFGGSASQYDECVNRGFIPPGPQKAEDQANVFIKASEQFTRDKEGFEFVQKGWDIAKQKLHEQSSEYWKNNCDAIAKQWNKYVEMLKLR